MTEQPPQADAARRRRAPRARPRPRPADGRAGRRAGCRGCGPGDRPARCGRRPPGAAAAARAEGAGESGLSRLIGLHAFNAAGDTAVAISLAGTLFFQVPTGEARSQVALFLGLTMLPFAIVAPLIGPFLDRFSHGRRWAIGATMAIRAFLCWVLGTAVITDSQWLFPAALGVLVSSKAYAVTRAAAVPRLHPGGPAPGQGQRPHRPRRASSARRSSRADRGRAVRGRAPSGRCGYGFARVRGGDRAARSGCPRRSTPASARARCC